MPGIVLVVRYTIENLRDGDQERAHQIAAQSFGGNRPFDPSALLPSLDRTIAAYDGQALAGRLKIVDSAQWFGGRSVSMGGVSGVIVAPEYRRRGIAQQLLDASLQRMHEMGTAISTLYATTATLYRSRGYEFAGTTSIAVLDAGDADMGGSPNAELIGWDDPRVRALYNRVAQSRNGWLDRTDYTWASAWQGFEKLPEPRALYGIVRADNIVAVAGYSCTSPSIAPSFDAHFDMHTRFLFAQDGAGLADALTLLALHGPTAGVIEFVYPTDELRLSIRQGQRITEKERPAWMTRLIDAKAAIAARGFTADVTAEVHLDVIDPQLPHNHGPRVLQIQNGTGVLETGGRGDVSVDVGDLASLYTGYSDAGMLRAAGRLAGAETGDVEALRRAFSGSAPHLVDFF